MSKSEIIVLIIVIVIVLGALAYVIFAPKAPVVENPAATNTEVNFEATSTE